MTLLYFREYRNATRVRRVVERLTGRPSAIWKDGGMWMIQHNGLSDTEVEAIAERLEGQS